MRWYSHPHPNVPNNSLCFLVTGVQPMMVPTLHPELLATPYGLLMNELCRSPDTIIEGLLTILRGALACDTGSVVDVGGTTFNESSLIILYAARLGARVDNYITFLIDWHRNQHQCIDWPLREMDTPECNLRSLLAGQKSVREILHSQFDSLLDDYLKKLGGWVGVS